MCTKYCEDFFLYLLYLCIKPYENSELSIKVTYLQGRECSNIS